MLGERGGSLTWVLDQHAHGGEGNLRRAERAGEAEAVVEVEAIAAGAESTGVLKHMDSLTIAPPLDSSIYHVYQAHVAWRVSIMPRKTVLPFKPSQPHKRSTPTRGDAVGLLKPRSQETDCSD